MNNQQPVNLFIETVPSQEELLLAEESGVTLETFEMSMNVRQDDDLSLLWPDYFWLNVFHGWKKSRFPPICQKRVLKAFAHRCEMLIGCRVMIW